MMAMADEAVRAAASTGAGARARAPIVRDPRLLPYYLTPAQAAALCCCAPRTLKKWRADGTLVRGTHFTQPRRGKTVYLRDGLIAYMEARERGRQPAPAPRRSALNLQRSPAAAAALYREVHGLSD